MSLFSRKKEVNLEDFCRDFYDNQILNPMVGTVDASSIFVEVVKKTISEVYPKFADIDLQKLNEELIILRFELFALAWSHKFVSGEKVVSQSYFTKRYLHEKGRNDVWEGMESYNNMIDGATLHWLTSLGKANLGFNYRMREDLGAENIKFAKELGVDDNSLGRVNHRLWSENAWRQKIILTALQSVFYKNLGINPDELNDEALFRMAAIIKGLYDGANDAIKEVKIKN
jgi:hypothetical protein